MVNMGKKGETLVEVRLFDSARFYRTSSSAWSQEDVNQEPQVDDREWANWDDEDWVNTDDDEDEDEGDEYRSPKASSDTADPNAAGELSPSSTARSSPAAREPPEPESRRKLLVGATPGRLGRPHRDSDTEPPPPIIPSVPHGGEESGWGASYTSVGMASPTRASSVHMPNEIGLGPEAIDSPRPPPPQAPGHKATPPEGRPLPTQPQPRVRSRGRYLGSAGGMGLPLRSRGSDKGAENQTPAVRLSPLPASAPALDTGSLADMMAPAMVSPRTAATGPSRRSADSGLVGMDARDVDHDEFLPAIHGTKMSQVSQKLTPRQLSSTSAQSAEVEGRVIEMVANGRRRRSQVSMRRAGDNQRQYRNNRDVTRGHAHGGWGRRSHDEEVRSEQEQIRLPSLSLGLVVTNAVRGVSGEVDAGAAHESAGPTTRGQTESRQHLSSGQDGRRVESGHNAVKGKANKRRQNHQHRHLRHPRGHRGREHTHPALAVVSRRHGVHRGVAPVSVPGHADAAAPAGPAVVSRADSLSVPGVLAEREPPQVLVTAASQLQQNVMRQIDNDNLLGLDPAAGSTAAAANARSEARRHRQQLRLTRGLP